MGGQGSEPEREPSLAGPGAAARLPADRLSHPSTGQVLGKTERTDSAAVDPSRRNDHRAGVPFALTSRQVRPPVPIRMIGLVAAAGVASGVAAVAVAGVAAVAVAPGRSTESSVTRRIENRPARESRARRVT